MRNRRAGKRSASRLSNRRRNAISLNMDKEFPFCHSEPHGEEPPLADIDETYRLRLRVTKWAVSVGKDC